MLPRDTGLVADVEQVYAYFNSMTKSELARVLSRQVVTEINHFSEFSEAMGQLTTNGHLNWLTLKSRMSEIRYELEAY
jgi:hypothetical protein